MGGKEDGGYWGDVWCGKKKKVPVGIGQRSSERAAQESFSSVKIFTILKLKKIKNTESSVKDQHDDVKQGEPSHHKLDKECERTNE